MMPATSAVAEAVCLTSYSSIGEASANVRHSFFQRSCPPGQHIGMPFVKQTVQLQPAIEGLIHLDAHDRQVTLPVFGDKDRLAALVAK